MPKDWGTSSCAQCLAPTYMGDFALKGAELRKEGLNRIGNMLVPNSNYCLFEDWLIPVFKAMMAEQEGGTRWTPSSVPPRPPPLPPPNTHTRRSLPRRSPDGVLPLRRLG